MDLDELKEEKKRMKESLLAAMYKTKDSWNIGCSGKSEENDEDEDNEVMNPTCTSLFLCRFHNHFCVLVSLVCLAQSWV